MQHSSSTEGKEKILSAFDLASVGKTHIQKVMNYTNDNKTEKSTLPNILLTTLYRKLNERHLEIVKSDLLCH